MNIKNHIILIDDEDYERIKEINWKPITTHQGILYFYANLPITKKFISLHRFIMNAEKEDVIDHKDNNHLNFHKSNLRKCTNSQNAMNKKKKKDGKNQFKGIHKKVNQVKYEAYIYINYKKIILGYFSNPEEAHQAYCKAAKKYHGEFARFE